jgi:hypothetical protein
LTAVIAVGCATPPTTHTLEPALTSTWDPQTGNVSIAMRYAWFDGDVAWPTMLDADQHVMATFADQMIELVPGDVHDGTFTEQGYVATVPSVPAPDGLAVSVAVAGMPEAAASATFPDGFAITSNVATSVSRAFDDLVIDWSPVAGDEMGYTYSGDCLDPYSQFTSGTFADIGTIKFQRGIFAGQGECDMTLTIERIRDGVTNPGGASSAIQQRTVHFTSIE